METEHVTFRAKAQNGKVIVHTEIPVSTAAEEYVVTIDVVPQPYIPTQTLDHLYGALADNPLSETE